MDTKRIALAMIVLIGALAVLGIGSPAPAATRCQATVHAALSHVEPKDLATTHTYTVDVSTLEPCARIRFTLYSTERISKTRTKVFKTESEVRLRDGATSTILNYDMPKGREMVSWEVKLTRCERCEP